ncbi:threonine ammonia-lyase [Methanocorpusculum sp. MG]|uniref:threonine ammonia-lyase n=1 Tax=Methanocorpusculum petauri TaxID=3002863 RepID=A0ABT4ID43_9EURY|nr:threonine ammonia-lyase [Methanocorpusculum petauri]MCZ0859656.1 threonine ammonia-lyase [Methanocorpusculum petauri]MDE2444321.1 threonine ammonia-lyase [Methanocorpusculum sp.]
MLTLDKIYHAAYTLRPVIRKTDIIYAPNLSKDAYIYLKTENLQVTGSFKVRGAYYKISRLSPEEKAHGVIACSAGNHAQGVALAAAKNGINSLICIPDNAPISKIEATKSYGAEVELVNGDYDEAYARACELQHKEGRTFIHPFDDDDVIAGQGTIGLEILDQLPNTDAVIVPIGGGGLIAGIAFAIKQLRPDCKVYGVQTEGAPAMKQSFDARQKIPVSAVSTFADGIAVKCPGDITFDLISRYVDEIVTVTDDEAASAVLELIEHQKLIAEGAGAVAVAAAMFHKLPLEGKNVVCVLSGGNIDVTILSRVITRGLLKSGRVANLTIPLIDKPGQLQNISEIIATLGGNVVSVHHDRGEANSAINSCVIKIGMETRDQQQIDEIKTALTDAGYQLI